MIRALALARLAGEQEEIPVGAVVVVNGRILGEGFNRVEMDKDPSAHAEIIALREAARSTGDWRLLSATLYVTLEPCIMCAGALIFARIERLVYGAPDERWGAVGSLFDLAHDPRIGHDIEVIPRVMEQASAVLLQGFFRKRRCHTGG